MPTDATFTLDKEPPPGATLTKAQQVYKMLEASAEGIFIKGPKETTLTIHFDDNSGLQLDYQGYRTGTLILLKELN